MHRRSDKVDCRQVLDYALCGFWGGFSGWQRAYITDDETKVTCKTCLKIMGKKK